MYLSRSVYLLIFLQGCSTASKTPKSSTMTQKTPKATKKSKGDICIDPDILDALGVVDPVLEVARGSATASSNDGVEGWRGYDPLDFVFGTQWTVNSPGSNFTIDDALYGTGTTTSVKFRFTDDYSRLGDASLCIENRCPGASNNCDAQKGFLQYYYRDVLENAALALADCGDPCLDPTVIFGFTDYSGDGGVDVQPISVSDFTSFSYDIYPVECGAAADTGDNCGSAFYANIRFVHDFLSDGGTCGFFDCSFDYQLPTDTGPEGSWTTFRIDGNTVPWRIRQSAGCNCPLPGFTPGAGGQIAGISINQALENADFADMKLGTGYGEIAALNVGAEVGGPDYNLHGCFDNIIFSTTSSTDIYDIEQSFDVV